MHNLHNLLDKEDNHYTLLGVTNKASGEEIKKAYRKLSLEYHPDRNGNNKEKSEKYKNINKAYEVLRNDSERKKYDFSLNNNLMGLGLDIDPSVIMNMFLNPSGANSLVEELSNLGFENIPFGGFGGIGGISLGRMPFSNNSLNRTDCVNNGFSQHNYSSKPATIFKTINISLLESYKGCKLPLAITRWLIELDTKVEQTETIYIDIPKGVDNDEIIIIPNKGNRISDTNRGNIEIKVSVKNHEHFERNGIDLIFKKSITLKESFCGFSFDLMYIDGKEFKINNKAGNVIPSDFRKVIHKMGLQRDDNIGDLIIIFDIVYPKQFTTEQIEGLDKLL